MQELKRRIKHWPTTIFGLGAIVGGFILWLKGTIDTTEFVVAGLAGLGALGYGPKKENAH